MAIKKQPKFADRLARIDAGKANVCGTVYIGDRSSTSRKTTKQRKQNAVPGQGALPQSRLHAMTKGGMFALLQVLLLGGGLVLYFSQASL
jgi:hypothetical protein